MIRGVLGGEVDQGAVYGEVDQRTKKDPALFSAGFPV